MVQPVSIFSYQKFISESNIQGKEQELINKLLENPQTKAVMEALAKRGDAQKHLEALIGNIFNNSGIETAEDAFKSLNSGKKSLQLRVHLGDDIAFYAVSNGMDEIIKDLKAFIINDIGADRVNKDSLEANYPKGVVNLDKKDLLGALKLVIFYISKDNIALAHMQKMDEEELALLCYGIFEQITQKKDYGVEELYATAMSGASMLKTNLEELKEVASQFGDGKGNTQKIVDAINIEPKFAVYV